MPKLISSVFKTKILALLPLLIISGLLLYYVSGRINQPPSVIGCTTTDFTGNVDTNFKTAVFEGEEVRIPEIAAESSENVVLGAEDTQNRWIEIDLSDQKLKAWDGDSLFLETAVSSGLPWFPTPKGEFRIWIKLRSTKMSGGEGRYAYYLPNVPYVMFFEGSGIPAWKGYGLHGTYWHNDFGTPRSHGCVNLPTPVAERLYYWTSPVLPDGKWVVYASDENPGTRIVIHD